MGTKLGSVGGGLSLVGENDPDVVVDTTTNPITRRIIIIMKTIEIVFNDDFLTGSAVVTGVVVTGMVVVGTLVVTGTVVIGTVGGKV